jgi:hypothetical protein
MNNSTALIRSLITFGLCVPFAIWLGFMLADPFDRSTFSYFGVIALILCAPILFRWHHFLLVCTWNLCMTLFFLPGFPLFWLPMTALSLGLSVLHRTINEKAHFLSAPSLTWPLLFLIAVVLFTAKMTGGIGLHSLGNETMGGKFYFLLLVAILGYFALTAQQIPPKRVKLYVGLFFLAGFSTVIGDLATRIPYQSSFIFAFFPPSGSGVENQGAGITETTRFGGVSTMGLSGIFFMLACYGTRGIFLSGRLWRPLLFGLFSVLIFFGGFRSLILTAGGIFLLQGYLEGLHRSKVFPVFVLAGVLGLSLLIPFAHTLPFTFQRSLAFLPLKLDPVARRDAEDSQNWRLGIWKEALPTVPQYLLLGKGYAISQNNLDMASSSAFHYASDLQSVDLVGNYHSGPLSVVIPFGLWGVIAVIWFWIAGVRALYFNYRYGDPEVRSINIFLFAYFLVKIFMFLIVFGGLYGDMYYFAGILGLGISINGGIRQPVRAPVRAVDRNSDAPLARPRFQPFYPR